ncbi:hypothetical protein BDW59DRAFT_157318 [Aspergillus cavernicola]|uniref:BTB domain-containing protein n=1 Tax=Aspergillus cavernicola TaxID=176166 RepID=A0ABR4J058_9EURO
MAGYLKKETLSAGIAHINVGPQHTPFNVHLELLCNCSPYFNAVFKDRAESNITEDPVSLPDDDPDVFAEVVSWMYRGTLSPDLESRGLVLFLLQLWMLAGNFQMPALQSAALSVCEKKIEKNKDAVVSLATISYVYARTAPGALPRQLVIDTWTRSATTAKYAKYKDHFPRDFLEELCGKLIAKIEPTRLPGLVEDRPPSGEQFAQRFEPKERAREVPSSRLPEDLNFANLATPEQMQNRKFKSPSPRFHRSSPVSAPGLAIPGSGSMAAPGEAKDGGVKNPFECSDLFGGLEP